MTSVYTVRAPFAGRVRPVSDVPDPVFADGLMGPGPALEPTPGATVEVCAPVDGRIVALKPHALVITPPGAPEKVGVLVHLGIDTVTLRGEGFAVHVAPQDEVRAGDRLITWTPPSPPRAACRRCARSRSSPWNPTRWSGWWPTGPTWPRVTRWRR